MMHWKIISQIHIQGERSQCWSTINLCQRGNLLNATKVLLLFTFVFNLCMHCIDLQLWGHLYISLWSQRLWPIKKKKKTFRIGQVVSSTNGSNCSAGIESLILSALLVVQGKSMADLEKALRCTVNGILYCWKLFLALLLPLSLHSMRTLN